MRFSEEVLGAMMDELDVFRVEVEIHPIPVPTSIDSDGLIKLLLFVFIPLDLHGAAREIVRAVLIDRRVSVEKLCGVGFDADDAVELRREWIDVGNGGVVVRWKGVGRKKMDPCSAKE